MVSKVSMIVLAAGSGTRMGAPKALLHHHDGTPLLERHVHSMARALEDPEIIVVLGAGAATARPLVPEVARIVDNPAHDTGMGSSLQAGLRAVSEEAEAVVVTLVDLTDIPDRAYDRLLENAGPDVLARCTWNSVPGHPVMFGRSMIQRAIAACHGDTGAKDLFRGESARVLDIECGDLLAPGTSGTFDVDTPADAEARGLRVPETRGDRNG